MLLTPKKERRWLHLEREGKKAAQDGTNAPYLDIWIGGAGFSEAKLCRSCNPTGERGEEKERELKKKNIRTL